MNFLLKNQHYELAYSTWLLFMPSELMDQTGLIFNGSFETKPSGTTFDWTIGSGKEVDVSITTHPDDDERKALYVDFGVGRAVFPVVQERILLPPGSYQFSFLVKGELSARRGLEWRIVCENGAQADEGKTILGRFQYWRRMLVSVNIPNNGCRYQYLRLVHLARSSSEQMAHGHIWFDDLSIERSTNNPQTTQ